MNRIIRVFLHEIKWNVKRKGYLFATFGIPLIAIVIALGYQVINGNQGDTLDPANSLSGIDLEAISTVGIVDESGFFQSAVSDEDVIGKVVTYGNAQDAQNALDQGAIDGYYVVAPDYEQSGKVVLFLPEFSIAKITDDPVVGLFFQELETNVDGDTLNRLRNPVNFEQINLERNSSTVTGDATSDSQLTGATQNDDVDTGALYIFSIIFLLGLFLTNGYLMQSVIEEKENRVIEILISSVTPSQLLIGKILALSLLGLFQLFVWVFGIGLIVVLSRNLSALAATFIPDIYLPVEQLPIMLVYFILGYLVFAGVFGAVGAISTSMREGPAYAVVLVMPAALPYYFFSIFAETPNAPLPTFLSIFPLTSPVAMMMRLSITNVPTEELLLSIGLLAAFAVLILWMAGRIFRMQSLLSGQVPKIKDIPRLIRG